MTNYSIHRRRLEFLSRGHKNLKILFLSLLALIFSTPAIAGKFLYICNDPKAKYYDKVKKEGPFLGFVSASVLINTDEKTAELVVGSRNISNIGKRSNSDMSLLVEKENSQILFTGTTHDESIYFTLYTKEMKVVASYEEMVVQINGCNNIRK